MGITLKNAILILCVVLGLPAVILAENAVPERKSSCCPALEASQAEYLASNRYNEFFDLLNKSKDKTTQACRDYYKANTRYLQLKYLEEKQSWDDYFANGNTYRDQLVGNAQKAVTESENSSCLRVKSRLLLWQFHRDQQDAFAEKALADLSADAQSYATGAGELNLLREVADKLLAYDEKAAARQVYKLYVDGFVGQKMTESAIKNTAASFYKQGNLELAESIYDIYIEKISQSTEVEKFIPDLFEIANLFVYKQAGLHDMGYAEKIYSRIEELGTQSAFSPEAIYLRAFNLEKMSAYEQALKFYQQATRVYPFKRFEEATYKIGMIYAYALANVAEARRSFEVLAVQSEVSPYVLSSIYQLGLLAQWQGDLVKATSHYDALIHKAEGNYAVLVARTKERLKEIQDNQPVSYNLKMFLDIALKNDARLLEMNKSELRSAKYILDKNQNNIVSASVNMPQSGCTQVDLQYLWSGDLGGANPGVTESNFEGAYADAGTKEVNIVIISPSGAIDRYFTMLDVY